MRGGAALPPFDPDRLTAPLKLGSRGRLAVKPLPPSLRPLPIGARCLRGATGMSDLPPGLPSPRRDEADLPRHARLRLASRLAGAWGSGACGRGCPLPGRGSGGVTSSELKALGLPLPSGLHLDTLRVRSDDRIVGC